MHRIPFWTLGVLLCLALFPRASAQQPDVSDLRTKAAASFDEGRWEDAADQYRKLVEVAPDDGTAWHHLGYALHALGRLDEALPAHVKAASFTGRAAATAAYNVACVHALQGRKDEAFKWLEKAATAGFRNTDHMADDPDMDALRDDPRYEKIVAAMEKAPATVDAFVQSGTTRKDSRVFYWSGNGSPGQFVVSYGPVKWKPDYEEQAASAEFEGRRWRLGSNFWTSLDSNLDITLGGVKVPAGYYYLVVEKEQGDKFRLLLLDPAKVRAEKMDAFQAEKTEGGTAIPLQHRRTEKNAEELGIDFEKDAGDPGRGRMRIRFGPHELQAAFVTPLAKDA